MIGDWILSPDPKLFRCYVVVSRQALIDSRIPTVACSPVFSRAYGSSTQVLVGIDEGLKHDSWILCDNFVSVRKTAMTHFVGTLSSGKMSALKHALKTALALD